MSTWNHYMVKLHLLLQLILSTAYADRVPAIIVFGDSTVDSGNNNVIPTVLKSNFRPYGRDFYGGKPTGRFSNGKVASDFISEGFGLKPDVPAYLDPAYGIEDFATGVCFASAGTGYDTATSDVLSVIPLWKEVKFFAEYKARLVSHLGTKKATKILHNALYIVSIGTNDFLENYYISPRRSLHFTIQEFEDFLIDIAQEFIVSIYRLGARKISMTSLSPIGCLPLERALNVKDKHGCEEKYNVVAKRFNYKMGLLIKRLNARLPGLRMVFTEIYDALHSMIQNPSLYGFENVELGCCATGMFEMGYLCNELNPWTCPDADKYLFWDAFHPSEKTNRILAKLSLNTSLAQFR